MTPGNVLISHRNGEYRPKIADFGMDVDVEKAKENAPFGTWEYMSPEARHR